ncbi:MAG: GNAT family N-acetyltransferase, partial [Planctomycetota bacterium]
MRRARSNACRDTGERDSAVRARLLRNARTVYALLGTAFHGMDLAIPSMEPLGAVWHELSTPFVIWENQEPIAHAGVLEIDLVVEGEPLRVPGIHAVCTHPDHRGRGHARELMERALVHIDARFATSILFADVPAMYEKFGYRTVPQSRFTASGRSEGGAGFEPCRDVRRIHEMLAVREPVSNVLGCVR